MKIALRRLYSKELKLGWADGVRDYIKSEWVDILCRVKEAEDVTFNRYIKPTYTMGKPILIICNDGSEQAICATDHIRWECKNGVKLICGVQSQKLAIPRIEMQAAVLGVRYGILDGSITWWIQNVCLLL